MQQFNIYVDPELIAAAKHHTLDEQLSLSDHRQNLNGLL